MHIHLVSWAWLLLLVLPVFGFAISPLYGSSAQAITITINSLASASERASTAISNATLLWSDVLINCTIVTGSTGTAATGYVQLFIAASVDGGSTYPDNATGTDGAVTQVVPPNSELLHTFNCVANTITYHCNAKSVAALFGGNLPQSFVLIVVNQTGHALAASGCSAQFQGIGAQYAA